MHGRMDENDIYSCSAIERSVS